jgi:hypothetical protein
VARTSDATLEVADYCYAGAWVAPVPLLVFDRQTVVFANAAALDLLGYARFEDLVGAPLHRALHSDALTAELARRDVIGATHQPILGVPTKLRARDGEPKPVLADVFPIEVEGADLTLFAFGGPDPVRPLGKPGPAPAPPATFGPQLGWAVLEPLTTSMMIQTLDTIVYANRQAREHMRANDRSDLEGRSVQSIVHPDGIVSAIERVLFVFATQQRLTDVPVKLKAIDGSIVHAIADAYPMRTSRGWAALISGAPVRAAEQTSRG